MKPLNADPPDENKEIAPFPFKRDDIVGIYDDECLDDEGASSVLDEG
jgi:hypothetical protein